MDTLGHTYVCVRLDSWDEVVARWLTNDRTNRARIRLVLELNDEVAAADKTANSHKQDAEECKERFALAMGEIKSRDETIAKRERKIDRLRPWSTGAKVVVGLVVLGAIGKGVNAIAPGTIPML